MKRWSILLIVGSALASGCASTPTPNPWDQIQVDDAKAQTPLVLPDFPVPAASEDSQSAIYTPEQIRQLDAYRTAAEANTAIAAENAAEADDLRVGAAALVEAGKAQRVIADMRAEILTEERRRATFEKLGYWGIILALGISSID